MPSLADKAWSPYVAGPRSRRADLGVDGDVETKRTMKVCDRMAPAE